MDYGWTLHTTSGVRANKDCREWFIYNAPDFCHIIQDFTDLGVAYALKFHTRTTLTKAWDSAPEETPPPILFYYEQVHKDPYLSLEPSIDWPWGFWSTSPDDFDACDIGDFSRSHLSQSPTRHLITYMGISSDRKHVWTQLLDRWIFVIEIQVEVEYDKFTPDECLALEEMRRCASDTDRAASSFMVLADGPKDQGEGVPGLNNSTIPQSRPEEAMFVAKGCFATTLSQPQVERAIWPKSSWTPYQLAELGRMSRRTGFIPSPPPPAHIGKGALRRIIDYMDAPFRVLTDRYDIPLNELSNWSGPLWARLSCRATQRSPTPAYAAGPVGVQITMYEDRETSW
ncbi:hypothetical protein C8Q76DRAFT_138569 [Earliella scabrosa]|nr:hypothetical protein C8Q76DRAFT_138569 [Earliella scabrosa]